jgi:hypothetical protein
LYFSSHEAEAITPLLKKLFSAADVIVVELGLTEEDDLTYNLFTDLSKGNLMPDDVLTITHIEHQPYPEFTKELVSMIYRSGKTILVERSPFDTGDKLYLGTLAGQEFRNMPLGKACRLYAENLQKQAEFQKKRDEAFAQQLANITTENPSSNILALRGDGHQPSIENALSARNVAFTSVTSHKSLLVYFTDELTRKIIAGGRPTRRELLRSLVEQAEIGRPPSRPTQANIMAIRGRVAAMTELKLEKYLKARSKLT